MNRRVLIVGRSAPVLLDTVAMLRDIGYAANGTNQFDRLLDDYEANDIDLVVFGGQVPGEQRAQLEAVMAERAPNIRFISGLGGVAPLLAAQIEEYFGGTAEGVAYDAGTRTVRVRSEAAARVTVTGVWAVAVDNEPSARSAVAYSGELSRGEHAVRLPDDVPPRGSFAIVRIDDKVTVLPVAEVTGPRPPAGPTLPVADPLSTKLPWEPAAVKG